MKLHPRYQVVAEASHELRAAIWACMDKHKLTYGEATKLLAEALADIAKYAIREERHPDNPGKKGDEA